jgi:hypothetical protein
MVIEMEPAHMHMHLLSLVSMDFPPAEMVGAPGIHGPVVAGTQGIGVSTPSAAAVADMTVGFVGDLHTPKEAMLVMGAKSIVVAAGLLSTITVPGSTLSGTGAAPMLHWIKAPVATKSGMRTT